MQSDSTEEMEEGVEVSVETNSTDPGFLWECSRVCFQSLVLRMD